MQPISRGYFPIAFLLIVDVTYGGAELVDRFQKEYPNAAAKLMTQVEHVKGTIKFSKNSDNASARTEVDPNYRTTGLDRKVCFVR